MQARIHQIAAPQAFGDKPLDWIEWAAGDDVELSNKLAQIARPSPALLHLDYHSLNVLTDGREITAVLDWANTQAGDPRADFARTYTILMVEPYVAGKQSLMLSLVRRLLTRSWRRGYEEVNGRLPDMSWFFAWAGSVMAVDLGQRVDDPDSWWQRVHLEKIRDWTAEWRERAENSN
jgi:aminoglycoside phosphotransferase (APT) family kinase protein